MVPPRAPPTGPLLSALCTGLPFLASRPAKPASGRDGFLTVT